MKRAGLLGLILAAALLLTVLREPLLRLYYRVDHLPVILREARRHELSPHLVAAVIFTESRFREAAESEAGASGLMQLMPETAREMAEKENLRGFTPATIDDPGINIRLGTRYLAELKKQFPDERDVLAAYNAGPTTVRTWRQKGIGIGYKETRAYVEQVQHHRQALESLYPEWGRK